MNTPDAALEERNYRLGYTPFANEVDAYVYRDADSRILLVREDMGAEIQLHGFREEAYGWTAAPIPLPIMAAHAATSDIDMVAFVHFEAEG